MGDGARPAGSGLRVRRMTADDVPAVVDVQRAGSVLALAAVFPQDTHPFPADEIADRWREEVADPAIDAFVGVDGDDRVIGFAATTGRELLHFGTAVDTWGHGTAHELHDAVVDRLRGHDGPPLLFVFEHNPRARRFYAKHGWRPTGARRTSGFPPHPVLLAYSLLPDATR